MPPRYAYWTILVDGQPTAFRAGALEDIMPTFNRLKEKQPTAELKWFQNGQLWPSRHDAQDFMRARGDRGRARDPRQSSGDDAKPERAWNAKPEWKSRTTFSPRADKPAAARTAAGKPEWKPKGSFDAPPRAASSRSSDDKPEWKPKRSFAEPAGKPEWKPKRSFDEPAGKPEWKPKRSFDEPAGKPEWKPKRSFDEPAGKPEWKPKAPRADGFRRNDRPEGQARSDRKPEWKPKGTFKPKEAGHASGWGEKPGFSPRTPGASARRAPEGGKPEWKPKGGGSARDQARASFRPKAYTPKPADDGMTRSSRAQSRSDKLEWKPASAKSTRQGPDSRPAGPNAGFAKSDPDGPKRKWVPKAEYKKSLGIEAKRDDKWRPGGEHKDPKQKYKDAKKAKWTRFKQTIRARSAKPRKPE